MALQARLTITGRVQGVGYRDWAMATGQRLGLTGALGTVSEIEDGVYTGRLVGSALHGKAKADAVRALEIGRAHV